MAEEIKLRSPVRPPHGMIRIVVSVEGERIGVKQTDGKGRVEYYERGELMLDRRRSPIRFIF